MASGGENGKVDKKEEDVEEARNLEEAEALHEQYMHSTVSEYVSLPSC